MCAHVGDYKIRADKYIDEIVKAEICTGVLPFPYTWILFRLIPLYLMKKNKSENHIEIIISLYAW